MVTEQESEEKIPEKENSSQTNADMISLIKERFGSERGAVIFRKQAAYYLKGVSGGKKLKEKIFASTDIDEVCAILTSVV